MSPFKIVPLIAVGLLALGGIAQAQVAAPNTEFKIAKIIPNLQETPNVSGNYDKRVNRPKKWLEVQVDFDWQPRLKDPKYTDELTFNYYILLANGQLNADRKPTMLTGTITHVNIPQEKDLHAVAFVSPRTIERFFGGTMPVNVSAALIDVGVTISKQGQVVAEQSFKGKGAWWASYQATPGLVLSKDETPFGPLAWDYFEAVKSKSTGN